MKTIQINGTSLKIRFDMNTLIEYEELTGKSALNLSDVNMKDIRSLAYVGFKEHNESFEMTEKEVGSHLTTSLLSEIMEVFSSDMSTMTGTEKK